MVDIVTVVVVISIIIIVSVDAATIAAAVSVTVVVASEITREVQRYDPVDHRRLSSPQQQR